MTSQSCTEAPLSSFPRGNAVIPAKAGNDDLEANVTCGTVRSHPALLPSPLPRLRTRAMLTDLTLASLHPLLVFGLVSMLVAQAVLLRGQIGRASCRERVCQYG